MDAEYQNLDQCPIADLTSVDEQVPIIDIAGLLIDSSSEAAVAIADDIALACQSWGFFQVINHGISDQLIENVWRQTQALFALPIEEKLAVERTKENPWGYYNNELTKNQRDKKEVYDLTREGIDPIYGKTNRWPAKQDTFRATMLEYFDACTELSLKLLEAFCIGLNLPARHMHGDFETNHTGFLRLNYYPVDDPLAGTRVPHRRRRTHGIDAG
jgi:isopenicillin N synthase-like dioxygenase